MFNCGILKMKYMGVNVFVLYFLAMYSVSKNAHWILKVLLHFWRFICIFSLGSLAALCLFDVYLKEDYIFIDISGNVLNTGIFIGGSIRISYYFFFDHKSKVIVDQMNKIFKDQSETGMDKERNMKWYKSFTIGLTIYWSVVVFFTGEFTALLPLAFLDKTGKMLPIQAHYPYDWKADGWYEFTMFTQALTQFVMGFAYGNSDMFYVCALYLTAGQFKLLAWEFENVIYSALIDYGLPKDTVVAFSKTFNDFGAEGRMHDGAEQKISEEYWKILDVIKSKDFAPVLKRRMVQCINMHQNLLDFSRTLNDFFAPILLPCLSFGLFYIIFIAFTLLVSTDRSAFLGLTEYLITALVEVFLIAIFGQILTNENEHLKDAMYTAPWYLCKNDFLTILKFSHFKASDQVVIKAGPYFTMGLDLFISLCKTAGSYFAVLRQVTE